MYKVGDKIVLIRQAHGDERIHIHGTINQINEQNLATVIHKWGVCYENLSSPPGDTRTK